MTPIKPSVARLLSHTLQSCFTPLHALSLAAYFGGFGVALGAEQMTPHATALFLIGTGLLFAQAALEMWGRTDLDAKIESGITTLPHQAQIDLARSNGLRVFYPDLVAADITFPGDPDHDDPLTVAIRTLHKEGRYIVTGPDGITKHRFIEATDAPTRRRKQFRSVPRKP